MAKKRWGGQALGALFACCKRRDWKGGGSTRKAVGSWVGMGLERSQLSAKGVGRSFGHLFARYCRRLLLDPVSTTSIFRTDRGAPSRPGNDRLDAAGVWVQLEFGRRTSLGVLACTGQPWAMRWSSNRRSRSSISRSAAARFGEDSRAIEVVKVRPPQRSVHLRAHAAIVRLVTVSILASGSSFSGSDRCMQMMSVGPIMASVVPDLGGAGGDDLAEWSRRSRGVTRQNSRAADREVGN